MKAPNVLRALIVCGSTSSGKSAIGTRVAQLTGGEIVNADSRQVYRDMPIGTGMPPSDYLEKVPHHLYGFVDPSRRYSAAHFAKDAQAIIASICDRGKLPVIIGGTGFYIEALTGSMTLDRPPPDDAIRSRLRHELRVHSSGVLWDWLAARRPALAARISPTDPYRIIRGLETTMSARQPMESARRILEGSHFVIVRLVVPRKELRLRIERRVREMFLQGLLREAVAVRAAAPASPALSGLGYAEALALWDGLATEDEAVKRAITRTEQYSKRQETWFRHMRDAISVDAMSEDDAIDRIVAIARERLMAA